MPRRLQGRVRHGQVPDHFRQGPAGSRDLLCGRGRRRDVAALAAVEAPPRARGPGPVYEMVERPLVPVIAEMEQIGRASCRERGGSYVVHSAVAVSVKTKKATQE